MSEFASEEERLLCHLYTVFYAELKMCGCNQPDAGIRLVYDLLRLAPFYENERWRTAEALVGSDGAFQLVISLMSDLGLLEHGSSLGGSWLGRRGRWVLWAAEQVGGIDGLDDRLDLAGYPHADRECDSGCWAVPEGWGPAEELPEPTIAEPVVVPYPTPLPGPPARLRFNQDTKTWEAR